MEANIFSYHVGTNYLKSFGFEISEEAVIKLSGVINNDLTRLDNLLREIEGELVNINEVFANFIKDKTVEELYLNLIENANNRESIKDKGDTLKS